MKIIALIKLLLFLNIANLYSDKNIVIQLDTMQKQSLTTSDLIFLGKLIKLDTINSTLHFSIVEKFMGNTKSDSVIIAWEKHNRIYFEDKSLWLVYSNKLADSSFILNENALSRSIIHPEVIRAY